MAYTKLTPETNGEYRLSKENISTLDSGIASAHDQHDQQATQITSLSTTLSATATKADLNEQKIEGLSTGETPKGAFTPTGGSEYPTSPLSGFSYYITGVDSNGYTYTSGDLIGKVANNQDKIIYNGTAWSLIENNSNAVVTNKAVGNIDSPILHLPLKNSLDYEIGEGEITFTNDSTQRTYVDRYGVMQYAVKDEPRFEKEGLLIEGASTNVITNSNSFNATGYITTTNQQSPDGLFNSTLYSHDGGVSYRYIATNLYDTIDASNGATVSFFIKPTTTIECAIIALASDETYARISFDFSVETFLLNSNTGDFTTNDSSFKKLSNGWYRITLSFTTLKTAIKYGVYLGRYNAQTLGDSAYVCFYQSEALPFATSYTPTTTTAVTRLADIITVTPESGLTSGADCSYSVDVQTNDSIDYGLDPCVMYLYNDTDYVNSRVLLFHRYGNTFQSAYCGSGSIFNGYAPTDEPYRYLVTMQNKGSSIKLYNNGEFISSRSNPNVNLRPTHFNLGYWTSSSFYGHLSNLRGFDKALTEQEARIN